MAGHRLVIEARDDMQVGVEPALIVPAERVAVGSEPLVQLGSTVLLAGRGEQANEASSYG
jgi:hypothetical protein